MHSERRHKKDPKGTGGQVRSILVPVGALVGTFVTLTAMNLAGVDMNSSIAQNRQRRMGHGPAAERLFVRLDRQFRSGQSCQLAFRRESGR